MPSSKPEPDPTGRFFVITGGPGSGKSTLIDALRDSDFAAFGESGRAIIREQVASGGNAVPWSDPISYARMMLKRDRAAWEAAHPQRGAVFFDRGVPDIQGYLALIGARPLAEVDDAVRRCRYAPAVFIAPPWEAIYAQDAERKQGFAEACRTHRAMRETYEAAGYTLVELPRASVSDRLGFVIEHAYAEPG